jgi:DNA-binding response OmpR family regulator
VKVLLVDDEKELTATLAERLSFRGIDADWATSGQEALELADGTRYDLAVLDVKMPKMSGITLMKRLRDRHPAMKFIFMTGHGSEEDFKTGSADASHYLVKPVKLEALVEKMKLALNG